MFFFKIYENDYDNKEFQYNFQYDWYINIFYKYIIKDNLCKFLIILYLKKFKKI
jgi:hypothetical protein